MRVTSTRSARGKLSVGVGSNVFVQTPGPDHVYGGTLKAALLDAGTIGAISRFHHQPSTQFVPLDPQTAFSVKTDLRRLVAASALSVTP
ncbi:MAG: hypothetical protein ACPGUV_03310 [Polyangiales bacterium]